ncbi:unnamed protein product [Darwinula stevensoni]|uniref:Deoxyhypusine hydroxylase n=1 Tax=Darwinula stevensoni TaxID=69355 RepID=A0A7R8XAH3_9CRUS|nr:unnamed protein product [Darwinula stevensoni]CAG0890001.1 unnamed protein product [Darwinula stevensoni]
MEMNAEEAARVLQDKHEPLKDRFRALFTLRNIGGAKAIDAISSCFCDPSALLKHELAYVLGQIQDPRAIPVLNQVLSDSSQEPMVRHEAGEALGAIGALESLGILEKFCSDSCSEVAETCQLAMKRIQWIHDNTITKHSSESASPFLSVDPTPYASSETSVQELEDCLLDSAAPIYERYRAMFALRNRKDVHSVKTLARGWFVFQYVFGCTLLLDRDRECSLVSLNELAQRLSDLTENEMVRHECAEALGSIATDEALAILHKYLNDSERVVRESCVVALDIADQLEI